jgi:hypothetical protein
MLHHRPRFAGLLIIFAALVLAPSALAAAPAKGPVSTKAKEHLYGKHCGAKHSGSDRPAQRTKCLKAMSALGTGRSSSPRAACRALSRKKVGGEHRSAFSRCVSAGARLLKARDRVNSDTATEDEGDDPDSGAGDDDASSSNDPVDGVDAADAPGDAGGGALDPDDDPAS